MTMAARFIIHVQFPARGRETFGFSLIRMRRVPGIASEMMKYPSLSSPSLRDKRGQSTVEFALTLMLLMGFTMFFIRLALVFAYGNYVHYATFMAARAYQAAGDSPDSQVERAKEIVIGMLKKSQHETGVEKWPIIAKGQGGTQEVPGLAFDASQFVHGNKDSSWMQGVRYTFRSRIFLIPLGGGAPRINPLNDLELTSESWLGREVNFNECRDQMSNLGIWDNGC